MIDFLLKTPTEFCFGKAAELKAGEMLKKYKATKVLIHYGGGSVVKSGLLERVEKSALAAGIKVVKLGGAKPNPEDTLIYEGIELCRKEAVDFILAVGGGSTIDSAKAIAMGVPYNGDFWDFYAGKRQPADALPVATVLTIPAAGSEGSMGSVVNKVTGGGPVLKRAVNSELIRPVFSLLNPELNYTLPAFQTACGVADMMAHVFERYFTNTPDVEISDRLCEAILLTIIKYAPIAIAEPNNYAARANLTWAGVVAHDGTCGVGREEDWTSHDMEHELSALYDVAHGAGLAVLFPAWMKFVYEHDIPRFVRFATNVWGIDSAGPAKDVALQGIRATKDFFKSLGLPVNFAELGARVEDIGKLVEVLTANSGGSLGSFVKIDMDSARKIFEIAAQI